MQNERRTSHFNELSDHGLCCRHTRAAESFNRRPWKLYYHAMSCVRAQPENACRFFFSGKILLKKVVTLTSTNSQCKRVPKTESGRLKKISKLTVDSVHVYRCLSKASWVLIVAATLWVVLQFSKPGTQLSLTGKVPGCVPGSLRVLGDIAGPPSLVHLIKDLREGGLQWKDEY